MVFVCHGKQFPGGRPTGKQMISALFASAVAPPNVLLPAIWEKS